MAFSRSEQQHLRNKTQQSQLVAIPISDLENTLEWFGNYTPNSETPIILMPQRGSCRPYIYV